MSAIPELPLSYEFKFNCPQDLCDYASELCWGFAEVDSVMLHYVTNADFVDVPYAVSVFTHQAGLEPMLRGVLEADDLLNPTPCFEVLTHAEADWAEAWKRHWDVDTVIENQLTICPTWKSYTPVSGEVVLTLDPGSAFGTGAHETTRLMLERLAAWDQTSSLEGKRVLDLGCGSGVLGIYAAKLGASDVLGLDIDPIAVKVSQANAQLNEVDGVCHFHATPLAEIPLGEKPLFSLILANILGPVIIELLPDILRQLAPEGRLICSGLIEPSCTELREVLARYGLVDLESTQLNQWFSLEGTYRSVDRPLDRLSHSSSDVPVEGALRARDVLRSE